MDVETTLWLNGLLLDLTDLAQLWATYRGRHADDDIPPAPTFCAGVEVCADQLREAVARARRLSPDGWQLTKPAMQPRITDA